jgi:hypothetical protein
MPAFACSWLYFTIVLIDSWLGIVPASESLFAFKISINFIFNSPVEFQRLAEFNSRPHFYGEPQTPKSTPTAESPHEILPVP